MIRKNAERWIPRTEADIPPVVCEGYEANVLKRRVWEQAPTVGQETAASAEDRRFGRILDPDATLLPEEADAREDELTSTDVSDTEDTWTSAPSDTDVTELLEDATKIVER